MDKLSNFRIKVTGYPPGAEKVIDNLMRSYVDLAYVDPIGPDYVLLVGDVDFQRPDDFTWRTEAIDKTLRGHWIYAKFELIELSGND